MEGFQILRKAFAAFLVFAKGDFISQKLFCQIYNQHLYGVIAAKTNNISRQNRHQFSRVL